MRILILSSSTGGGHDMRARSLESWCRKLSTDSEPLETFRFQALEESAGIYKFGVELYNWIQKKCPWLHLLYFNWLEIFQISASERLLLGKAKYIAQLEAIRPDVIVSVHAHTNLAMGTAAVRGEAFSWGEFKTQLEPLLEHAKTMGHLTLLKCSAVGH